MKYGKIIDEELVFVEFEDEETRERLIAEGYKPVCECGAVDNFRWEENENCICQIVEDTPSAGEEWGADGMVDEGGE